MYLIILYIISGLTGLWLGTKLLLSGAIQFAERFKLSHSFVGLGILALGTDLPEIAVTLKSALMQLNGIDTSGIITGNAIGSSVSQITFIMGISALFLSFKIKKELWTLNFFSLLGSIVLLFILGIDRNISRSDGIILMFTYAIYYYLMVKNGENESKENNNSTSYSLTKTILMMSAGLGILILSSEIVVVNALSLSEKLEIGQTFIGITIVGLGTSLPELAVSIGAAIKKSAGMSVGNIIGSNIFDGLIPIGLGATINPTAFDTNLIHYDLPMLFIVTLVVMLFFKTKRGISKTEGIFLIVFYFIYLLLKYKGIILF